MDTGGDSRKRVVLFLAVGGLIALNLVTFIEAYPETTRQDSGCCGDRTLAKDFSAFYTAAWRLFNDPSQVYTPGIVNDGGPAILPAPEAYKYVPSFLFMVAPFLSLGYQQALTAFDIFQFLLLPLIALLLYALVKQRGPKITFVVAAVVLVLPLPWPHWGLSVPYYWQWGEGQSKVLETFLLLLSFYLGMKRRPALSGLVFALAVFDPRFILIAMPLFVMYNGRRLGLASAAAVVTFLISNSPLLYPGMGSGFIRMIITSGASTPPYYYTYIPLAAVVALSVLNAREIAGAFRNLGHKVKL